MITSIFGEDEELKKEKSQPEVIDEQRNSEVLDDVSKSEIDTQNDVVSEEGIKTEDGIETIDEIRTAIETGNIPSGKVEAAKPFEVNRPIGRPQFERNADEINLETSALENLSAKSERELELERKLAEIEAELLEEKEYQDKISKLEQTQKPTTNALKTEQSAKQDELEKLVNESPILPFEKTSEERKSEVVPENARKIHISHKDFKPESKAETIRKSGLAWSAAIALFGSIVFMMILGWFADQLLGSFPWGITVGITLGAIIGFLQFFRMTSQIINPKPNDFEKVSLYSNLENTKSEVELPTNEFSGKDEIKSSEDFLK